MSNQADLELAAKVAHEVNRAYCLALGDDSQVPWDQAPEDIKRSAIKGMRFLKDNPSATPEKQHEAWKAAKVAEGWVYGSIKDPVKKTHPCIVDYESLPLAQRLKDDLFQAVGRSILNIKETQ